MQLHFLPNVGRVWSSAPQGDICPLGLSDLTAPDKEIQRFANCAGRHRAQADQKTASICRQRGSVRDVFAEFSFQLDSSALSFRASVGCV